MIQRRTPKWMSILAAVAIMLPMLLVATPALAHSTPTAVFSSTDTGTYSAGGVLYARSGRSIKLTVAISGDFNQVSVTGAHVANYSNGPVNSKSFNFTSNTGDGNQTVNVHVRDVDCFLFWCDDQTWDITAYYVADNTGPVVTGVVNPAPNAAGWNNTDVTIDWSATDGGAGIATQPADENVTTEGITDHSRTVVDRVGNSATGTKQVKIDKHAPVVTGVVTPTPNGAGWNNTDVVIDWSATDTGGSGLAAQPADEPVTAEGITDHTKTVTDVAGNTSAPATVTVKLDKTAPTAFGTAAPAHNGAGWNNTDVSITWTCSDLVSGITCPGPTVLSTEGTAQVATVSLVDNAGNTGTGTYGLVNIDKSAPALTYTVSSPNPMVNGWYQDPVTVTWACDASISGLAGTCPAPDVINVQGMGLTATQTITDLAGNPTTITAGPFNIDLFDPTWPVGAVLNVTTTQTTATLTWTAALHQFPVTYSIYKDGVLVQSGISGLTTVVTGLTPATTYLFRVDAVDVVGDIGIGPSKSATTLPPNINCTAAGNPVVITCTWTVENNVPWLVPDTSIAIRVRNATTNVLYAGYTYGAGITFSGGVYTQTFNPAQYNVPAGTMLKIQIYLGGKLKQTLNLPI